MEVHCSSNMEERRSMEVHCSSNMEERRSMEVHCSSNMEENKQHSWKKMSTAKQYKDGRPLGKESPKKGGSQERRRELRRSTSLPVRVASAAREQRARLYIMRRCVSMLVSSCWKN